MKDELKASVAHMRESTETLFEDNRFVVFLCGPTYDVTQNSSLLRKSLEQMLVAEDFEVVLGEDDGLEELRKEFSGLAHENELSFIQDECSAVVLIADSVGSFCELGLFAHQHYTHNPRKTDFVLIMDEQYKGVKSYLNEGPASAVDLMGGKVFHGSFEDYDLMPIVQRLKGRRSV